MFAKIPVPAAADQKKRLSKWRCLCQSWIAPCLGVPLVASTGIGHANANDAVVRSAYCFSALQASAQNALQHQYEPNQLIADALQRYKAYLLLHMTDPDTTVTDTIGILAAHDRGRRDFYACLQQLQSCYRSLRPAATAV